MITRLRTAHLHFIGPALPTLPRHRLGYSSFQFRTAVFPNRKRSTVYEVPQIGVLDVRTYFFVQNLDIGKLGELQLSLLRRRRISETFLVLFIVLSLISNKFVDHLFVLLDPFYRIFHYPFSERLAFHVLGYSVIISALNSCPVS